MLNVHSLNAYGFAWAQWVAPMQGVPNGPTAPRRDVLRVDSWLRDFALSQELAAIASRALGGPAFAVRANLFAKSAGSNWSVPWHQDRVVCVAQRADVAGFTGWSIKAGLHHANAPAHVLRDMVGLRVHLDPCPEAAGALEVLPRSHLEVHGDAATRAIAGKAGHVLEADRGMVLVMRPLLLHRSRSFQSPSNRRVLHVEFARQPLPMPLRWNYCAEAALQRERPGRSPAQTLTPPVCGSRLAR